MLTRILSPVICIETAGKPAAILFWLTLSSAVLAQTGYYTDDVTGIVYERVTRTIDRPVVQTQIEKLEETVYRPRTIQETSPQINTIYTPVLEYKLEPRVHGRWNPFQRSTVAYHHVPQTRWEARNEVVQRTSTRTEWVAEKRVIDVPRHFVRMERQQEVDYRPVGRVAPSSTQIASNQATGSPNTNSATASRLRPIDANTRIKPLDRNTVATTARSAAQSMGMTDSQPQQRSIAQSGIPATDLNAGISTLPMLPPVNTNGVATLPAPPVFR